MFDFAVEHLSWLERRLGIGEFKNHNQKKIAVMELTSVLKYRQEQIKAGESRRDPRVYSKIMVIMPWFSGGAGDAGHSVPELRQLYLNITFWSFYRHIKDISVCVCTKNDHDYLANVGLPWFEIIQEDCHVDIYDKSEPPKFKERLFKPALLGVLTSRRAQHRLRNRSWHHQWIFYTESDQVLYVRNLAGVLHYTDTTGHYIAPHRLIPMPVISTFEETYAHLPDGSSRNELTENSRRRLISVDDEFQVSCCFDRGTCDTRAHWKMWNRDRDDFTLISVGGSHPLISAEGNFLRMHLRTCRVQQNLTLCP